MKYLRTGLNYLFLFLLCSGLVHPCWGNAWTDGTKTLLYIRIDFSDHVGEPVSEGDVLSAFRGANEFLQANSNGRTSLKVTLTPTLRVPQTLAHYRAVEYNEEIINDARTVAKAAGFDTAKYDFDIVAFRRNDGGVGGVGAVNGKGLRLFNDFSMRTMVHELGHNFGLPHAGLWLSNDGSILSHASIEEYGNPFDWMGGGGGMLPRHFNARSKNLLGWVPDSDVQTITNNGIYRLNAHDFKESHGVRALKINRGNNTSYWLEFRQGLTELPWPMNGIQIMRSPNNGNDATLEDMTPNSRDTGHDASLLIGRTFSDWDAGIHITPLNKVGTRPESVDVLINRGDFSQNQAPKLSIRASATTALRGETTDFTATASDPDGDELNYFWEFGDGFMGGTPIVTQTWQSARDYVVRCTVSDGKGGTANASLVVHVNFASQAILKVRRFEVKGKVLCAGAPLQDVRVQAGSAQALTDSDGTYTLVNLPARRYEVTAHKLGYDLSEPQIIELGTGTGVENINFMASALEKERPQVRISQPLNQSIVNQLETVAGTTWDNADGSGIARVKLFIQHDNTYWNGLKWDITRTALPTLLEGNKWSYATNLTQNTLVAGNYQISAIAYDRAGNSSETITSNSSLTLDGIDDYLSLERISGLGYRNPVHTIEAWVRVDNKVGTKPWLLLLGSEGDGAHYWLVKDDGIFRIGVWGGGERDFAVPADQWNHLASVFDGTTLRIYVNGVLTETTPARFNLRGIPFTVGRGYLTHSFLKGAVREVSLWKVARKPEEILADMNSGLTGKEMGLISFWPLNAGAGSTATDTTGNTNNAQLVNVSQSLSTSSVNITIPASKGQ